MTQLEQDKDKFMRVVDGLLPLFILFPVLGLIFPFSWFVADEFYLGFWVGAFLFSVVTAAYILPLAIEVAKYRQRRLEQHQLATRNSCYTALRELEARGLRWAFHEHGEERTNACDTCDEQTVTLNVDRRYQPVPGSHEKHVSTCVGSYCPGCGERVQERGNPFDGNLKLLLQTLEEQNDVYFLQPPRDEAGMRKRIASLEERIDRGEFVLTADRRQHAYLRDMLAIEELKRSPAGYRIAAELPPAAPPHPPDEPVEEDVEDVVEEEKRMRPPPLCIGTEIVG